MLAGLGTDESGERGGKRGLKRRCVQVWNVFWPFEVFLCPRKVLTPAAKTILAK